MRTSGWWRRCSARPPRWSGSAPRRNRKSRRRRRRHRRTRGGEMAPATDEARRTMSTLDIPGDVLKQAGISDREALIELACGLFAAGKLSLFFAAKLAQLPQPHFEDLLLERKIPVYRYDGDDLRDDLKSLRAPGT